MVGAPEGSLLSRLRQHSSEKSFSPQEVAHIVRQAAGALQHAHTREIIHQDVKPSNFLLCANEENPSYPDILLGYFGIARLATATSRISQSIRGTPTYMAPEQWEGRPVSATDQYGLAVMTYELLTGRLPFQGGFGQLMYQHLMIQPAPPSTLNPHLSKEIDTVILAALAKDPKMRFASITAFALAFNQAVQALEKADSPAPLTRLNSSISADYHAILAISTTEAAMGTTRNLTLPGGRHVTVAVPPKIQDGQVIRLEGQGEAPPDGRPAGALLLTIAVKPAEDTRILANTLEQEANTLAIDTGNVQALVNAYDQRSMPSLVPTSAKEVSPTPVLAAPNTPLHVQQLPETPVPPSMVDTSRRRPGKRTFALLGLVLLLLLPISYFALPFLRGSTNNSHPAQNGLPPLPAGIGVVKAPTGEYIGISNGNFAFDTKRPDGTLKQQGAAKLSAGDVSGANYLWQQAVAKDTNDAEALIYLEDLSVRQSGHPMLTVVIGTTLTGSPSAVGTAQANLRGAYVAQKEYNSQQKLPGGVLVYLLVANSGSDQSYATYVAKQIAQLAQSDKTIVGVMGWTLDAQLLNALAVLAPAHIPMVANAGNDELTGKSSYAFRVVSNGVRNGTLGAQVLEKTLHVKTAALFTDPQDDQSRGVARGFTQTFTGDGNTIVATEHFTMGKTQNMPTLLQDALSKHPDAIYFAGRSQDANALFAHLQPTDPPVIGPSSLYNLQGYSQAARVGLSHLYITAGSYPDEWDVLGLTAQKPAFFAEFKAAFNPHNQPHPNPYEYDRPDGPDILSYDCMAVLLYASSIALTQGSFLGSDQPGSALWQALHAVTGKNAFQGVSGSISFGPDGGAINKAMAILCVDKQVRFKMDAVLGQFQVNGPPLTRFPTTSLCA